MESSVVGRDATIAEEKALENAIDSGRHLVSRGCHPFVVSESDRLR